MMSLSSMRVTRALVERGGRTFATHAFLVSSVYLPPIVDANDWEIEQRFCAENDARLAHWPCRAGVYSEHSKVRHLLQGPTSGVNPGLAMNVEEIQQFATEMFVSSCMTLGITTMPWPEICDHSVLRIRNVPPTGVHPIVWAARVYATTALLLPEQSAFACTWMNMLLEAHGIPLCSDARATLDDMVDDMNAGRPMEECVDTYYSATVQMIEDADADADADTNADTNATEGSTQGVIEPVAAL